MDVPGPVLGTSVSAIWFKRIRDAIIANRILDGPGYRTKKTVRGVILEILAVSGGSASGVQPYRVKSVQDETITCRTWNFTTEGSQDVLIAKPIELRKSWTTDTITFGGQQIKLTYSGWLWDEQSRQTLRSDNHVTETEWIVPRYAVDSVIWADSPIDTGVTGVKKMDTNRTGRYWSATS